MRRNLMEEHKQRFGCEKPIIGCLHLRALPGTPLWDLLIPWSSMWRT